MHGIIPKHLQERFSILDKLHAGNDLPEPWKKQTSIAVGGLTCVGFGTNSDLLLVVSQDGRGLIDCLSGAKIARDSGNEFNLDIGNLTAEGIGPLEGKQVHVGGLYGGGLACVTNDGWSVERHPLSWPDEELILSPPGQTMLWSSPNQPIHLFKLTNFISEIRSFGLSPTGRSFIVATSADILIFSR